MTSLLNCPKCHSIRSVASNIKAGVFKKNESRICRVCRAVFFIAQRKKRLFPSEEVKEILRRADEWRKVATYQYLKGKVMQSDREFISQMVEGALLVFRQHSGYLEQREDKIVFIGRLQIGENERITIEVPTDLSIEEYKLYLASDPERKKQLKITPHNPYNLYVSFMRERKPHKVNHIVEVGADINFEELTAEVRVDGGKSFCVRYPFPKKEIVKLQKRENKYRAMGELEKMAHVKQIAAEKTKRTYQRFIEKVHKEARLMFTNIKAGVSNKNESKTSKTVKYVWRIENPRILRNMHSQWMSQGWRPTLLKNTLKEKAKYLYLEVETINPKYSSVTCNKCGKINKRESKIMQCECGETIDWQRNAAINILNKNPWSNLHPEKQGEVGCLPLNQA